MKKFIFAICIIALSVTFCYAQNDMKQPDHIDSLYAGLINQLTQQKSKTIELQEYIKIEAQLELLYFLVDDKKRANIKDEPSK